jgi:pSer/pThr/pTyr-binding forkhead associated (FHA) protein
VGGDERTGTGGRSGAACGVAADPLRPGGEPAGRGVSRLRVVDPPSQRGRTFELGDELTVGRAAGCQITIEDNFVSHLHARVFRRDGQVWIEDLGSTNGTYLNQEKVGAPAVMHKGDRIQVGETVLELN